MKDYVLISDSTADLPVDIVSGMDVQIVPFSYSIDDEVFYYDLKSDVSGFYGRLRKGAMPVTSQVNPQIYKEYFENAIKDGKDVLYVCFSSGLSGSYQAAGIARDMLEDEYPDAKLVIVDSLCASVGEGVFLYYINKLKQDGMSIDELASWIIQKRNKVNHWFMVDDLFHLKRGGRLNTVEAMVGSALKIKPILSVDEEGKLVVRSKTRGNNKALEYLVERLVKNGGNLEEQFAVIGHADVPDRAQHLKEMAVAAGMREENILIAPIGPIIGTHVGAGMTAIAFLEDGLKEI
jgi:DegV family protein with EDD domain